MIITIDGVSASGKTGLMRDLGSRYNLPTLDTGLLYRKVGACYVDPTKHDKILASEAACVQALNMIDDSDPYLRQQTIGKAASIVGAMPHVRHALLSFQKDFAYQTGGAILCGRDTGIVIAPDATAKFFLKADVAVRAKRRARDIGTKDVEAVMEDLINRDNRDPNLFSEDTCVIDTTSTSAYEKLAAAVLHVEKKQLDALVASEFDFGKAVGNEDWLNSSPANRESLLRSIAEMNKGRGDERKLIS